MFVDDVAIVFEYQKSNLVIFSIEISCTTNYSWNLEGNYIQLNKLTKLSTRATLQNSLHSSSLIGIIKILVKKYLFAMKY